MLFMPLCLQLVALHISLSCLPLKSNLLSFLIRRVSLREPRLCTLEKVPLFLFRVPTPPVSPCKYFLGGIGRDESDGHIELPFPLQCSVKMEIPGSDPTLMNMVDSQTFPR